MSHTLKFVLLAAVALTGAAYIIPSPIQELFEPATPVVSQASFDQYSPCGGRNAAFQPGEEITYKIYYNWQFVWMAAGEVTFKVDDDGDLYQLSAQGRTYDSYEWFYKVRDDYTSYVDKSSMLPVEYIQEIEEGKFRAYDRIHFDQIAYKAVSHRGKTKFDTKEKTYDLGGCMHDVLSMIYYLRNVDFDRYRPDDALDISVFMDKKTHPVRVNYRGKEARKKIKGQGRFNTIHFSPEMSEGEVFEKGTTMDIWVSDDNNRVPVQIESPLKVGSIKAVLKSHKNLRHPLKAKVK